MRVSTTITTLSARITQLCVQFLCHGGDVCEGSISDHIQKPQLHRNLRNAGGNSGMGAQEGI